MDSNITRIGSGGAELCVSLTLPDQQQSIEPWAEARLNVEAVAGSFKATLTGEVMPGDLAAFRTDVQRFNKHLQGVVEFEPGYEGFLRMRLQMADQRGNIQWDVTLQDGSTQLTFSIYQDQSYLNDIIASLGEMLEVMKPSLVKRVRSLFKK